LSHISFARVMASRAKANCDAAHIAEPCHLNWYVTRKAREIDCARPPGINWSCFPPGINWSSFIVTTDEAAALISGAISTRGGRWADLGAGDGTFTWALAQVLGPDARIHAVDKDKNALVMLKRTGAPNAAKVTPVVADFTGQMELPGLNGSQLDGILLANALHFVPDAADVLSRVAKLVRTGGRVVIVEYERRAAGPWVPYPVPIGDLPSLGDAAGLTELRVVATRPSKFGGLLYVAAADRVSA
jgi:SAM-dependent methyltransferase